MCDTKIDQKKRRVLISPLNWGLGHATRLIPIIDALITQGHYCIIAGESPSIDVLKAQFPNLPCYDLHGFNIRLSKSNKQGLTLLSQTPRFIASIKKEHIETQLLIRKHNIDLIISDNRYGVYSKKVDSVIITHQTNPYLGKSLHFLRPLSHQIIKSLLLKFDECWIPDTKQTTKLSGSLSPIIKNTRTKHLGLLSRLTIDKSTGIKYSPTDVLIILSGPEPQRSELEHILYTKFINTKYKLTILCGKPNEEVKQVENILMLPHCDTTTLRHLIGNSQHIICRSGYSTLMDLFTLGKKAILIPTPGQYEQEYLAQRMSTVFNFPTISQDHLQQVNIEFLLSMLPQKHSTISITPFQLPPLPFR